MTKEVIKRYRMDFKQHIVREYESGATVYELQRRYGITSNGTIQRCVGSYAKKGLRLKVMRIQHVNEQNRVRELEAQVKELESALAQVTLDKIVYQTMVEVAEREYGLNCRDQRDSETQKTRLCQSECVNGST